jgi:hypothetical protein
MKILKFIGHFPNLKREFVSFFHRWYCNKIAVDRLSSHTPHVFSMFSAQTKILCRTIAIIGSELKCIPCDWDKKKNLVAYRSSWKVYLNNMTAVMYFMFLISRFSSLNNKRSDNLGVLMKFQHITITIVWVLILSLMLEHTLGKNRLFNAVNQTWITIDGFSGKSNFHGVILTEIMTRRNVIFAVKFLKPAVQKRGVQNTMLNFSLTGFAVSFETIAIIIAAFVTFTNDNPSYIGGINFGWNDSAIGSLLSLSWIITALCGIIHLYLYSNAALTVAFYLLTMAPILHAWHKITKELRSVKVILYSIDESSLIMYVM